MGSVANYSARHGWRPGELVVTRARGVDGDKHELLDAGVRPTLSVKELHSAGITSEDPLPPGALSSLIQLDNGETQEYWLGMHNFYVITRYNHSKLYAMAVYQLSREILREHRSRRAPPAS